METKTNFKISEIRLSYHPDFKTEERPKISNSTDSYNIIYSTWDLNTIRLFEKFKILLLNGNSRVLGVLDVSSGGLMGTVIDPKIIFSAAIKAASCSIILAHNHPSGDLKPSKADISLTKKLKEGGDLLDIRVLDHLIVSPDGYFSFIDEGLL